MSSPISQTNAYNPYATYPQSTGYPAQNSYPQATYPQQQSAPQYSYPSTDYYGYQAATQQPQYSAPAYTAPATAPLSYGQPQFQVASQPGYPSAYPTDPTAMMQQGYSSPAASYMPQSQNPQYSMPILSPSTPSLDKYMPSVAAPAPAPMEAPPMESPAMSNPPQVTSQEPAANKPPKQGKSLFPRLVGLAALAGGLYVGYSYLFKGDGNNADDSKGDNVFTEPLKNYIQEKIKGTNVTEQDYSQLISELRAHNKKLSADDKISDGSFAEEVGRALTNMIDHGEDESLKTKAEQLQNIKIKLEESSTQTPPADETLEAVTKTDSEVKAEDKKDDKKPEPTKAI